MEPSNIDIIKFIMSSRWTSPRFDQIGCYVIGVLLPTNLINTMTESKFFNLPLCYKNDDNEI